MSTTLPLQEPVRSGNDHLDQIRATRGFHWWYPAIIDRMIEHPEWTKQQIANDLGVSYSTIVLVTTCDLFRAHYAKRREEINRAHDTAIGERLARAAILSLDKMVEHLESKPGAGIPLPQLAELSDKVLSRLGYGEKSGGVSPIQVNVNTSSSAPKMVVVSADDLKEARSALRANEQMKLVEGTVLEQERLPPAPPDDPPGEVSLESAKEAEPSPSPSCESEEPSVPLEAL